MSGAAGGPLESEKPKDIFCFFAWLPKVLSDVGGGGFLEGKLVGGRVLVFLGGGL
jgi:hypothetical protein